MTKPLNPFNVEAVNFDIEKFNDIVKRVRLTQKAVASFGSDHAEVQEKLAEARANIEKALEEYKLDDMQKFVQDAKRLEAKLAEKPTEKIQAFDEAMQEFYNFTVENQCQLPSGNIHEFKEASNA